jgi:death-on-curing protein
MHAAITGGAHHVVTHAGLESALGQPMQTWNGAFLYPSLFLMAGALLRPLAENQPFTDGNKRIAWAAAMVFLEINGISVEATADDVVQMMLGVAAKEVDVAGIAGFFEDRALHMSSGSDAPAQT